MCLNMVFKENFQILIRCESDQYFHVYPNDCILQNNSWSLHCLKMTSQCAVWQQWVDKNGMFLNPVNQRGHRTFGWRSHASPALLCHRSWHCFCKMRWSLVAFNYTEEVRRSVAADEGQTRQMVTRVSNNWLCRRRQHRCPPLTQTIFLWWNRLCACRRSETWIVINRK